MDQLITVSFAEIEPTPNPLPPGKEPAARPSFDELCQLERALRRLAHDAQHEHDRYAHKRRYCANAQWFAYFKPRLLTLVVSIRGIQSR